MTIRPRLPRSCSTFAVLALLASAPCASHAAKLSFHTAPPVPDADDAANLVGAANDRENIGGDGFADGDYNDFVTYVSGLDRPHQGQTFMTGANPAGYQVRAVWLRHAGYTSNTDATWWCFPAGGSMTVRLTRPSAANTFAFALASETFVTTGGEAGAPNRLIPVFPRTSDASGSGIWMRFALSSPRTLLPNARYGFDVTAHSPELFFETLGLRTTDSQDAYEKGQAYHGSTVGSADNSMSLLAGDRVFLVELSPAIEVARNGAEVLLGWPQLEAPARQIAVYRNESSSELGRVQVALIAKPATTYLETVPDAAANYWYWLVITKPDGGTDTFGPVATAASQVWTP